MNNIRKFLCFCIGLCCFASHSGLAEIYTWVDENGKKHFSDSPPEHMKNQSQKVNVQPLNSMPIRKNNQSREQYLRNIDIKAHRSPKKQKSTKKVSSKKQRCNEQWQEYRKQEMCFTNCRISKTVLNKTCIRRFGCKNMAKPQC